MEKLKYEGISVEIVTALPDVITDSEDINLPFVPF